MPSTREQVKGNDPKHILSNHYYPHNPLESLGPFVQLRQRGARRRG